MESWVRCRSQWRITNDELSLELRVESWEWRVEITIKASLCLTFYQLRITNDELSLELRVESGVRCRSQWRMTNDELSLELRVESGVRCRSQWRMTNDEWRIVIRVESWELRVEITIKVSLCFTFYQLRMTNDELSLEWRVESFSEFRLKFE